MERVGQLWGSLRGILRNHPTFAQIKDLVGAAGLPVEQLSHLEQKQRGGASKGQLMDAIDRLVNSLDEERRDLFVIICTKELLRRYGHLRKEVEVAFNLHGFGIGDEGAPILCFLECWEQQIKKWLRLKVKIQKRKK